MRAARLCLALVLSFAAGPVLAKDNPDGWRFAESQLARLAARPGERFVVVTDIDYTVLDPRARTQSAARAFGLGRVPLRDIRWDGRETARHLGLDGRTAERFQRFWRTWFWKRQHLGQDEALVTLRLLERAKAAGAEIVYLTGRNHALRRHTIARLKALGFPDADNVVTKAAGAHTAPFKVDWVRDLRAQGKRVLFYMTDSPGELQALRRGGVRVPMLLVRGLAAEPGAPKLRMKVPVLRGERLPKRGLR